MTERERMHYAKQYLEQMASGINPLNGAPVSSDDLVRDPHIANCLLYVADIVSAVLDNGGTEEQPEPRERKHRKPAYFITEGQRSLLQTTDAPIYVSDIADELNRFSKENDCRKLTAAKLNLWLLSIGMLEEQDIGRKTPAKIATSAGEQIGIRSEEAIDGKGQPFFRNLYTETAQQFVLDNIDGIIAFLEQE
ncbi:MAG: hypothetical protein K5695_07235 [Oscillospiraceae bacterium]|nr:hypothetical protein [Oscillospiraceae bacterium]